MCSPSTYAIIQSLRPKLNHISNLLCDVFVCACRWQVDELRVCVREKHQQLLEARKDVEGLMEEARAPHHISTSTFVIWISWSVARRDFVPNTDGALA